MSSREIPTLSGLSNKILNQPLYFDVRNCILYRYSVTKRQVCGTGTRDNSKNRIKVLYPTTVILVDKGFNQSSWNPNICFTWDQSQNKNPVRLIPQRLGSCNISCIILLSGCRTLSNMANCSQSFRKCSQIGLCIRAINYNALERVW